jgi:hypothetical protein
VHIGLPAENGETRRSEVLHYSAPLPYVAGGLLPLLPKAYSQKTEICLLSE